MKRIGKLLVLSFIVLTLFPKVNVKASENVNNPSLLAPDITIVPSKSRAITREAYVKNTAQQRYTNYNSTWGSLYNVTYKSIWFTNGVRQTGYQINRTNYYSDSKVISVSYLYRIW